MKKNQIISYIKNSNNQIIDYLKEASIANNNDANKIKNILKELKEIEKNTLSPIEELKKEKYKEYKVILNQEKEIKNKTLEIKNLISNKLTDWNNSLYIEKGETKPGVIFTDTSVKRYHKILIQVINIDDIPNKFINKSLKFDLVKSEYKLTKEQIPGLKITEKEVIK